MRIIAGEWKGRTIKAPAGRSVRPTGDRAREAWMSIVHPQLVGAKVLDLFAGTGALGLEALSRGAAFADFVEESPRTIRTLETNIASLGAASRCAVHRDDALRFIGKLTRSGAGAYDIAFADPPWRTDLALAVANLWLASPFAVTLGIEHEATRELPGSVDTRRYGDTAVTFYRR
jgi:16S rRNA (guanine966-N2)-methyltransferase